MDRFGSPAQPTSVITATALGSQTPSSVGPGSNMGPSSILGGAGPSSVLGPSSNLGSLGPSSMAMLGSVGPSSVLGGGSTNPSSLLAGGGPSSILGNAGPSSVLNTGMLGSHGPGTFLWSFHVFFFSFFAKNV